MKSRDPVLVGVDHIRAEPVYRQIFRRSASVVEAVPEIDGDTANPRDLLHAGEIVFTVLERSLDRHPLGGLDDDGDDAGRLTCLVDDRRIVQIHPNLFWTAVAVKREFL